MLAGAVAFSKRKAEAMDAGPPALPGGLELSSRDSALRAAIDRWVMDLGHEEHELRERLLEVKAGLEPAPRDGTS